MLAASPPHRSSWPRAITVSPRARAQIGLYLLAYLLYSAARYVTVGDLPSAKAHAAGIMSLERHLGVGVEASVQHLFASSWAIWLLNHVYLAAQLVVLPGSLIFLYHRSFALYERLRNTILATWLLSIPVYALFPVAPPRLAGVGLLDTISKSTGVGMDSHLTTSFYNQLAAVPSLHVGFAVAIGIAISASLRHPILKGLALLWGPLVGLAVVATGNHFVFDMVAGVAAAALGYVLGAAAMRARSRRPASRGLQPAFAEA
jgi:membrane-associated phospholipid phosphatase